MTNKSCKWTPETWVQFEKPQSSNLSLAFL